MKAILIDQPGDADVMRYGDAPDPRPGPDELVVRVRAAGVNRADVMQRRGGYAPPPGASPILGLEVAGEVVTPSGPWAAGDRVMAVVTGGAYAQACVVPVGMAMPIPERLSFEMAAAIPEAFLTAYLNLFTFGRLRAGESVLVHAGASGVGLAAIQVARAAGARVFTTAGSEAKRARAREFGAELAIDYKTEDFAQQVLDATGGRGVDVILDFIGAPYWAANLSALARGGRLMLIGFLGGSSGALDLGPLMGKNLTVTSTTLRATPLDAKVTLTRDFVAFALPRFERGELTPVVHSVHTLARAADAHREMEANDNIGKIVLRVE